MAVSTKTHPVNNKIVKRYIETGNKTNTTKEYLPHLMQDNKAIATTQIIKSSNVRLLMREELAKRGLDIGALADKCIDLLHAKKTVYATSNGKITDTLDMNDNATQKAMADLISDILGLKDKRINITNNDNPDNIDYSRLSKDQLEKLVSMGGIIEDADFELLSEDKDNG